MSFKSVGKKFFSYSYENNNNLIEKHIINNLKLLYEYEIIFQNNSNLTNKTSSFLSITLKDEKNNCEDLKLLINSSYKFQNRKITSIDINISLTENEYFSIYILEKPIIFEESKYENSPIAKNFINNIDQNIILHKKIKPTFDIKVACILDEFTYECFSYEVDLLQLKSTSWKDDMIKFEPDLLIVESAWYGLCNTWIGKIACENKFDSTLSDIINYCKLNNIPTVFFNKEGLVNFNYFKYSSSIFDYVFVSDENIIPYQKQTCNHNRVYPLSFAAQPKIHNSVNKNQYKLGFIAFAGGWYSDKHIDRLSDFEYILKPSLDYNVHIYDRNYHQRHMLEFIDKYWPTTYLPYILGKLDYKYMVYAYKNYDLFLNVNSVQNSSYMISRRVYEILCCKTMILSSYSKGIYNNFRDYIFISENKDETNHILQEINNNPSTCYKLGKKSQRYILENHTYKHRISEIFDKININYTIKEPIEVTILASLDNVEHIDNLYDVLSNQEYPHISICLLTPNNINLDSSCNLFSLNNIYHYKYSSLDNLIEIFNKINKKENYFAILNSSHYYGPNYIRDYINILSFAYCDVLGKSHVFNYTDNNIHMINCDTKDSYVYYLYKDTIFFNYKYLQFLIDNPVNFNKVIITNNNFSFYSDDEFNFICNMSNNKILDNFRTDDYII